MTSTGILRFAVSCGVFCLLAAPVRAHPLSQNDAHDRTIVVRLQKDDAPNRIRVRIEYRLEVAEKTVFDDMKEFKDDVNPLDFRGEPLKYYAEFAKIYAPILADRLSVRAHKKAIPDVRGVSRKARLEDEDGKALGHLRCDFVFESAFDIDPEQRTHFRFNDQTYYLDAGKITLSLVNETGLALESLTAPDEAVREQAAKLPGLDNDRLREIKLVFAASSAPPQKSVEPPPAPTAQPRESAGDRFALLPLLLHNEYGLVLTLLLAFGIGAVHALTPGHGKTLVAAYLVGERGTIWHALYLGLVTTLTHTGSVMAIAIIVALLPAEQQQAFMAWLVNGLGLLMGLTVVGIGFWLLLQRLAGRADHVHLGGGHHHHGPPTPTPPARSLSWWGLTLLGITGGMIPCVEAIYVLLYTLGTGEFWLVLPAVLAFSAGLAVVLVVIGILVVQVPRFAESRFGSGRLLRALPIASAIVVTLMGLWLCFETVRGL